MRQNIFLHLLTISISTLFLTNCQFTVNTKRLTQNTEGASLPSTSPNPEPDSNPPQTGTSPQLPIILNGPTVISKSNKFNLTLVNNGLTHYRYKVGSILQVNCSDPSDYSSLVPISNSTEVDITSILDGELLLCVIDGSSSMDNASTLLPATVSWIKDTTPPLISAQATTSLISNTNLSNFPLSGNCSEENQSVTISGAMNRSIQCASDGTWSTALDMTSVPLEFHFL